MTVAESESDVLILATYNFTEEQVAWVKAEANRRASLRPGSRPNRSEVAREAMEKGIREMNAEGRAA